MISSTLDINEWLQFTGGRILQWPWSIESSEHRGWVTFLSWRSQTVDFSNISGRGNSPRPIEPPTQRWTLSRICRINPTSLVRSDRAVSFEKKLIRKRCARWNVIFNSHRKRSTNTSTIDRRSNIAPPGWVFTVWARWFNGWMRLFRLSLGIFAQRSWNSDEVLARRSWTVSSGHFDPYNSYCLIVTYSPFCGWFAALNKNTWFFHSNGDFSDLNEVFLGSFLCSCELWSADILRNTYSWVASRRWRCDIQAT